MTYSKVFTRRNGTDIFMADGACLWEVSHKNFHWTIPSTAKHIQFRIRGTATRNSKRVGHVGLWYSDFPGSPRLSQFAGQHVECLWWE